MKSELLGIFEQYLLPLGANLKPALPGFITGVLLGLEEGTEFYDRFVLLSLQPHFAVVVVQFRLFASEVFFKVVY